MIRVYIASAEGGKTGLAAQREAAARLLAYAIRERFGEGASPPRIARSERGKPYFPELPSLHFNISHSGPYAVLAIGDEAVGVDIERVREINRRIARRFLDDSEGDAAALIRAWTRRESYGKYTGEGFMSDDLNLPHVFTEIEALEGYIITVCTASGEVEKRLSEL